MYVKLPSPSPVQQGDILVRPKKSSWGYHYGTGLSDGLVKDNTPDEGKHVTTFEGFHDGLPSWIIRPDRTPVEKWVVEQRALSNVGEPYGYTDGNCEHDMSFSQTGVAESPTVNGLLGLGALIGFGVLVANQSKSRPRRRRSR